VALQHMCFIRQHFCCMIATMTSAEFKRWLHRQGCTFEAGRGGHLIVRRGRRMSVLPMHGKQKELGSGLVNAIKRDLGLAWPGREKEMSMWAYPLTVEPDDNGSLLVSFVDIPEAHTFANDEDAITERATDCAVTALEGYMKDRRPIPTPSRGATGRTVVLPALAIAKIELYEAMRNAGVRKAELARRLRWHMPQVDRLLSLRHRSRLEHLEAALVVLDHHLELRVVRGVDRRTEIPGQLPRRPARRRRPVTAAGTRKPARTG
jgi:antitoxin HicB